MDDFFLLLNQRWPTTGTSYSTLAALSLSSLFFLPFLFFGGGGATLFGVMDFFGLPCCSSLVKAAGLVSAWDWPAPMVVKLEGGWEPRYLSCPSALDPGLESASAAVAVKVLTDHMGRSVTPLVGELCPLRLATQWEETAVPVIITNSVKEAGTLCKCYLLRNISVLRRSELTNTNLVSCEQLAMTDTWKIISVSSRVATTFV